MEKIRVFKRYQNRKLYDLENSCYATLGDLAFLILEGRQICVLDNKTQRDITPQVLTQIIVAAQTQHGCYSVEELRQFILKGVERELQKQAQA